MIHLFMFVIGACFGSFFNVVLSRKDWFKGRSHCESCGYTLRWFDLIPILSYLVLRGRCRKCNAKIDSVHLASEVFMGCGFLAVSILRTDISNAITQLLTAVFLCLCSISDIREKMVSIIILYLGIAFVMLSRIIPFVINSNWYELAYYLALVGAAKLVFMLLSMLLHDKIGEGDFDILLILIAATDLYGTLVTVTAASMIGTLIYLPLVLLKRYDIKTPLPLAPLLYVGFIIYAAYTGGGI